MQGSFTRESDAIRDIVHSVRFGVLEQAGEVEAADAEAGGGGEGTGEPAVLLQSQNAGTTVNQREAQQLDKQYAKLVVGHAKVLDISKAWVSENPSTTTLDQAMFAKLLAEILDRIAARELQQLSSQNKRVLAIMHTVRRVQEQLREAWDEFDVYSVSCKIVSAEDEILAELSKHDYFGWMQKQVTATHNKTGHRQNDKLRFLFRRSYVLQAAFARAVGTKILTEEIVAMSRSSIIEHNRSFEFYHASMQKLNSLVSSNLHEILGLFADNESPKVLFLDYRNDLLLKLEKTRTSEQAAATRTIDPDASMISA
eukprot:3939517-Rhodomonas_salina.1